MLFGHQGDATQQNATQVTPSQSAPAPQSAAQDPAANTNPLAVDPDTGVSYPTVQPDTPETADTSSEPSVLDQPSTAYDTTPAFSGDPAPTSPFGTDQASQPQSTPIADTSSLTATPQQPESLVSTAAASLASTPSPTDTIPDPAPAPIAATPVASVSDGSDLLDLKQQALAQLGPLVSHLDQAPEEKFRTTMMLIQSTDNSTLLQEAYAAARAIPDEKARAQALLDVVNEINYFTQQAGSDASSV